MKEIFKSWQILVLKGVSAFKSVWIMSSASEYPYGYLQLKYLLVKLVSQFLQSIGRKLRDIGSVYFYVLLPNLVSQIMICF